MAYRMGQMRFSSSGQCLQDITGVILSSGNYATTEYEDLWLHLASGNFEKGKSYYFSLPIPQEADYSMTLTVKLVNLVNNQVNKYQYIKTITIPQSSGKGISKEVVLYETKNNEQKVTMPKIYIAPNDENFEGTIVDELYKQEATPQDIYYLGVSAGDGYYEKTEKYAKTSIYPSWLGTSDSGVSTFFTITGIFTPVEDFSGILFEIQRDSTDSIIYNSSGNQGRRINLTALTTKLGANGSDNIFKEILNLIDDTNATQLSRIGIWGHSGLTLVVNGEEIHVGPSGHYEQDAVPVTTFGVVASTINDNWTMDYLVKDSSSQDASTISDGGTE